MEPISSFISDSVENAILKHYPKAAQQLTELVLKRAELYETIEEIQSELESVLLYLNSTADLIYSQFNFDWADNGVTVRRKDSYGQTFFRTKTETTIERDFQITNGLAPSDFLNSLGVYFKKELSDSSILTIHVIDSNPGTQGQFY